MQLSDERIQHLIAWLTQEPEPSDISDAEIEFIRLCRWDLPVRVDVCREVYGTVIRHTVELAADMYGVRKGRPVSAQVRQAFRAEIEEAWPAYIHLQESVWAARFGWLYQLISGAGLYDPYTSYWKQKLRERTRGVRGDRLSLRRRCITFARLFMLERWPCSQ